MSVQDVMAAVNPPATKTSGSSQSAQSTEDRFLTLLVAQMKNQDPMNPLDNAQVTSQMAQLSTVTGIEKLNTSLSAMSSSFMANQSLQAATMIGHSVLVPGSMLSLSSGTGIAGIDLQGAADKVAISIKDQSGTVVRSIDLVNQKAGTIPFNWDGKSNSGQVLADGDYTFDVKATQGSTSVTADKLGLGKVDSVSLGTQGVSLNVPGFGAVDATKVKQIF